MFSLLQTILYFSILIIIVVFVHEYGHFFVAKKCGVKIEEFAIGMGKKIFGFKSKDGVLWKICCLPIGGYVKMYGDDNATSFGGYSDNPSNDELKYALIYKHPLKKVAVAFAGPFMNFVLSILLFFVMFSFHGKPIFEPVIGNVLKNSYADKAGIAPGDRIISIDNNKISTFNDVHFYIVQHHKSDNININLLRNGKKISVSAKYKSGEVFGIMGDKIKYEKISSKQAAKDSFYVTFDVTKKTIKAMFNILVHQNGLKNIGGPITIAKESAKAGNNGIWSFIYFIAMISVSLGALNLLPIPLLDGGHIFVNLVEFITRRRFSNFAYKIFVIIGIVCVATLMMLGIINDLFFR